MIIVLALIVILSSCTPSWEWCVQRADAWLEVGQRPGILNWKPNVCGFELMDSQEVREVMYFDSTGSVAFAGDSTALRAYTFAANTFLPPTVISVIRKVESVPPKMVVVGHHPKRGNATMAYFKMRFVSTAAAALRDALRSVRGGTVVLTFGNWDMNWLLQRNMPMPGLQGPVQNVAVATQYWTTNVALVFKVIAEEFQRAATTGQRIPLVVIREQFMPNCNASRFMGKKNAFRRCGTLLTKTVVPLYRRIVSAAAWALNIPVISTAGMFNVGDATCVLGDGLHLNVECMMTEQQIIWNVVRHLRNRTIIQGGKALDNLARFIDEATFVQWMRERNNKSGSGKIDLPAHSQDFEPQALVVVETTQQGVQASSGWLSLITSALIWAGLLIVATRL